MIRSISGKSAAEETLADIRPNSFIELLIVLGIPILGSLFLLWLAIKWLITSGILSTIVKWGLIALAVLLVLYIASFVLTLWCCNWDIRAAWKELSDEFHKKSDNN